MQKSMKLSRLKAAIIPMANEHVHDLKMKNMCIRAYIDLLIAQLLRNIKYFKLKWKEDHTLLEMTSGFMSL